MATKKAKFKLGDYVRVNKTIVGVVCGFDQTFDEETYENTDNTSLVYVASVDKEGDTNRNLYNASKLTKIAAPAYVVVWSDHYNDPFCQFSTRPEAVKFATKLRKDSDIVEVRIYKLSK